MLDAIEQQVDTGHGPASQSVQAGQRCGHPLQEHAFAQPRPQQCLAQALGPIQQQVIAVQSVLEGSAHPRLGEDTQPSRWQPLRDPGQHAILPIGQRIRLDRLFQHSQIAFGWLDRE